MTGTRFGEVGHQPFLALLPPAVGSLAVWVAWGGHPVLLLVALSLIVADAQVRRGVLAALILLLPTGLGLLGDGTPVGLTIAGTLLVLAAALSLLHGDGIAPFALSRTANVVLLGVGSLLLVPQVSGADPSPLAVLAITAALAICIGGASVGDTPDGRGPAAVLVVALALLLPAITVVRSLVPDLFLQAAARRAPADLLRTVLALLGMRSSAVGLLAVSVAVLVGVVLLTVCLPAVHGAATPVHAGTLTVLGIASLEVIVVRARGGFDVVAVADRADLLLPVVVAALVLLVASVPPWIRLPGGAARREALQIALAAVLAIVHSLALLDHRSVALAGDPADRMSALVWAAGSLAGVLLAPRVARVLVGSGHGGVR